MDKIYCLMVHGGSLTDEVRTSLVIAAQEMMNTRERKMRLYNKAHGVKGWLLTQYKYNTLGTVGGFVFTAHFDCEGREIKARFIARPIKNADELLGGRWVPAPLFHSVPDDPVLN